MTTAYPLLVDNSKSTFGGLLSERSWPTTSPMTEMQPYRSIGARLQAIRLGFSALSQRAWAVQNGFEPTQYNNWETGARRIPVDAAEKLCETYGITLDFMYRGRRDGLSESASKVL